MGRLFWKILGCFWLAMIPMGIVIILTIIDSISDAPGNQRRFLIQPSLHQDVKALSLVLEHGGESAARRFLIALNERPPSLPPDPARRMNTYHPVFFPSQRPLRNQRKTNATHISTHRTSSRTAMREIIVLDPKGIDLLQCPVPQWAFAHAAQLPGLLSRTVISLSGQHYSIIAREQYRTEQPPKRRRWLSFRLINELLDHPGRLGWRLMVGLAVSGLVCFLLSWYLTQPVKKLRAATRRLSAGDFDIRVAQAIGARNDEIAELGWEFDQMADRLRALIASEQNLLNDISHELRSPLARMQIAVGLARQKATDAIIPAIERMEHEIQQLDNLVGQVLTLSRLDANAMEGCHDYVDLPA